MKTLFIATLNCEKEPTSVVQILCGNRGCRNGASQKRYSGGDGGENAGGPTKSSGSGSGSGGVRHSRSHEKEETAAVQDRVADRMGEAMEEASGLKMVFQRVLRDMGDPSLHGCLWKERLRAALPCRAFCPAAEMLLLHFRHHTTHEPLPWVQMIRRDLRILMCSRFDEMGDPTESAECWHNAICSRSAHAPPNVAMERHRETVAGTLNGA